MGHRRDMPAVNYLSGWLRRQEVKVQVCLALAAAFLVLVALKLLISHYDIFFALSEAVHAVGIIVLVFKLTTKKTCSCLSLKTQELTAIFLATRVYCSLFLEGDVHAILDLATFIPTVWVMYMMRFKLTATYIKDLDNTNLLYLIVPAAILAFLVHPFAKYIRIHRMLWAFAAYVEAVSVLPQLQLMQNAKMVEPFTAHYVFALGVARFLGCAHWILQIYESGGKYIFFFGQGYLWPSFIIFAEIVQTFILADFCYYYVKSTMDGQLMMRLPSAV